MRLIIYFFIILLYFFPFTPLKEALFLTPLYADSLPTEITYNNIRITLTHRDILQGDTMRLDIYTPYPLKKGTVKLSRTIFKIFENDRPRDDDQLYHYITYIGISRKLPARSTLLKLALTFDGRSPLYKTISINILDAQFKKEHITLPKKKHTLSQDSAAINDANKVIQKKLANITPIRHFNSPFIRPVKKGRLTSPYGSQRYYNKKLAWSHSGVDYGKKQGAPILATNTGEVVLSKRFKTHGNSILIDHGWGIFSIYSHLERMAVKPGDFVQKGQVIGTMGQTGIATGPHVHWVISVQSIRVNPEFWTQKEVLYD